MTLYLNYLTNGIFTLSDNLLLVFVSSGASYTLKTINVSVPVCVLVSDTLRVLCALHAYESQQFSAKTLCACAYLLSPAFPGFYLQ